MTSNFSSENPGYGKFLLGIILLAILILVIIDLASYYFRLMFGGIFFFYALAKPIGIAAIILEILILSYGFQRVKKRTSKNSYAIILVTFGILYMLMWPLFMLARISENRYVSSLGAEITEEIQFGALTPFFAPYLREAFVIPILKERDIKTVSNFEKEFRFNTASLCFFKDFRRSEAWGAPVLLWRAEFSWPSDSFVSETRWKPRLGFLTPGGFIPLLREAYENVGLEYIDFSSDKRNGIFVFSLPSQISLYGSYDSEASSLLKSGTDIVVAIKITEPGNIRYAIHTERLPTQVQSEIKQVLNRSTAVQLSMSDSIFGAKLCSSDMKLDFKPNQYGIWK